MQSDIRADERNAEFLTRALGTDGRESHELFNSARVAQMHEQLVKLKLGHGQILDKMNAVAAEERGAQSRAFDGLASALTQFKNVSFGVLSLMESRASRLKAVTAIVASSTVVASDKHLATESDPRVPQAPFADFEKDPFSATPSFPKQKSVLEEAPEDREEDCRNYLFDKEFNDELRTVRHSFIPTPRQESLSSQRLPSVLLDKESARASPAPCLHPQVARLLSTNNAYLRYPAVEESPSREALPAMRDPTKKVNVWSILKENIGKDVSRMSMPVYAKEPITLLEKVAEFLEYRHLLARANRLEDSASRMAAVVGFFLMWISQNKLRLAASFNSLMGETYEFVDEDGQFLFELVNNHPPVVACHGETPDYLVDCAFNLKTSLSMSGLEFEQMGSFLVTLKRTGEVFRAQRPKVTVHNFIFGELYIWLKGDLVVTNEQTHERGVLRFRPKGWTAKHDYEFTGEVLDSAKRPVLQLSGKWDSHLLAADLRTGQTAEVARMFPFPPDSAFYYNFSRHAINSNHKSAGSIQRFPPTESRLRPDVHAYEHGDFELASFEKNRLEENQRKRRKTNSHQEPFWFELTLHNHLYSTRYKGGYFEAREKGVWPAGLCDLFND